MVCEAGDVSTSFERRRRNTRVRRVKVYWNASMCELNIHGFKYALLGG